MSNQNTATAAQAGQSDGQRGVATLALASGSASGAPADMTDDPQYQAWVESMAKHCRCSNDRPCDGVLAGGLCDDIQDDLCDDDRVSLAYESDDLPAMDRPEDF